MNRIIIKHIFFYSFFKGDFDYLSNILVTGFIAKQGGCDNDTLFCIVPNSGIFYDVDSYFYGSFIMWVSWFGERGAQTPCWIPYTFTCRSWFLFNDVDVHLWVSALFRDEYKCPL